MIATLFQTSLIRNIAFFLKLFVGMLIANKYGAEGRGYVAAFILIPELIAFIGGLSISEGLLFYFAKMMISFATYKHILKLVLFIQLPLMLALAIIVVDYVEIGKDLSSISLYLLLIPAILFQELSRYVLRGLGSMSKFNASVIIEIFSYVILASMFILNKAELSYVILSQIIALLTSISYCQWHIHSARKSYQSKDSSSALDVYRYGAHIHVFNGLNILQSKLSSLFIAFYLPLTELGLFTIAATFSLALQMCVQGPISTVILPKLANFDENRAISFTSQITRIVTFVGVLYFILMSVFGELILKLLFGEEFSEAYYPMLLLILGMVFKTPMATLNCYFKSRGKLKVLGRIAIVTVPIQLILTIIMIPIYGIFGAALVNMIAAILFSYLVLRQYKLDTRENLVNTIIINGHDMKLIYDFIILQIKKVKIK